MAVGCRSKCGVEQRNEAPKGCRKGKCILNFNFNTGHFLAQQIQNISLNLAILATAKEKSHYENSYIANYTNIIWHPPEHTSFIAYYNTTIVNE